MAFALSIVKLEEALSKPGCPICRLKHESAQRSASTFLYENTLDPELRSQIMADHGFCSEHSLLLAAIEMSSDGPTLGINSIYEQLSRVTARELRQRKPPAQAWLGRFHRSAAPAIIQCPLCAIGAGTETDMTEILFEEIEKEPEKWLKVYSGSDGLCYTHLLEGVSLNGGRFQLAARALLEEAANRLEKQSSEMKEYLRKHDWHYRAEKLSPDENTAWVKTLTFFSGLPAGRFTHKIDPF